MSERAAIIPEHAAQAVGADPRRGRHRRPRGAKCLSAGRVPFRGGGFAPDAAPRAAVGRVRRPDRAVAGRLQHRPAAAALHAEPAQRREGAGRAVAGRHAGRPCHRLAGTHHPGLADRHRRGPGGRARHGHLLGGARGRHPDRVGAVPDPQDRPAAAADPVVRHRRAVEDRHHRARRVLPDHDLGLHRLRFGAAQPDPHGPELRPAGARHRRQDPAARRHARHPGGLPDFCIGRAAAGGRRRDDRRAAGHRRLRADRRQPDADRPASGRRGHAVAARSV